MITKDSTLSEAKAFLHDNAFDGVRCPCCHQFVKIYRRPINSGIAMALIVMYRTAGTEWLHKPTALRGLGTAARDESIARYWNLLEEETQIKRDDGGRAGWWRVTEKGRDWILGRITIPRYALIFDAKLLRLDGPPTSIRQSLGEKFSFEELMGG